MSNTSSNTAALPSSGGVARLSSTNLSDSGATNGPPSPALHDPALRRSGSGTGLGATNAVPSATPGSGGGMVTYATDSSTTAGGALTAATAGPSTGPGDLDGALSHEAALEEALDFEVHIDLTRLRDLAAVRVPADLRGKVHPLLLGVAPVDKTAEMTTMRRHADAFAAILGTSAASPTEDPHRGRRLRRFLGSDAGKQVPPKLRAELAALAAPSTAGGGQAAGGSKSSSAATTSQDAGASAVPAAVRARQLVTVEAVLAAHVPTLRGRDCFARGHETHLAPLEVVAPNGTWRAADDVGDTTAAGTAGSVPAATAGAARSASSGAHGGVGELTPAESMLAGAQPVRRHFSEPHDSAAPFQWHLWLAVAFGQAMESAQDAFFCTEALASLLSQPDGPWSQSGLRNTYSIFIMLLHHRVTDVYEHLHDLGVNGLRWAPGLLGSLFLDRAPLPYALDLLDYYIAASDVRLHPYVCAALLELWLEAVLDMEADDFIELTRGPWRLQDLPPVATLIRAASKLREEARARKLITL